MRLPPLCLLPALPLAAVVALPGQAIPLAPVIVTVARAAQAPAEVPFAVTTLDGDSLRGAPAATLDGALRSVPAFSLFRRSDSLSANPTAQGVSLRGLGPSGASRSLMLLDGFPLNDPFGGWVAWSKVPRLSLAGAEVVRGGGATAWGNAALGGVVQLLTRAPGGSRGAAQLLAGDRGTRGLDLDLGHEVPGGEVRLAGRWFTTEGFPLVAPEDRGPIDRRAASRHRWLAGRWHHRLAGGLEATFTARTFAERRNNGTPYQVNSTDEDFAALTVASPGAGGFGWTLAAYAQLQDFASTFSAVNADRTAETPAADQFSVPAVALGVSWTGAWEHTDAARTSAGADFRRVRGETREHFFFSGGGFLRQRVAGGRQEFAGVFVLHERPVGGQAHATIGARVDHWRDRDGHRDETDRATGAVLRSERHAADDGLEFSPSAGIAWQPAEDVRVRVAAQHAFRRPTLNELYRPFRVGNVITEANAALRTERVTGAELGLEWTFRRGTGLPTRDSPNRTGVSNREPQSAGGPVAGAPAPDTGREARATLAATVFWNELRDAVGNVTLVSGPGNFPLFGFIPAGGAGRQRLNLDRLRVRGLELSAEWRPAPALRLRADYLYNDATVRRAAVAPALAGRRLAQVPRHSAVVTADLRSRRGLGLQARARWLDRQFEDDENLLRLGAAVVTDLTLTAPGPRGSELFLTVENLTDARIETGRTSAGLVSTGTPRLLLGGLRANW